MKNSPFKNNTVPWQEKGRWYHMAYDISTNSMIADESDPEVRNYTIYTYPTYNQSIKADTNDKFIIDSKIVIRDKISVPSNNNLNGFGLLPRFTSDGFMGYGFAPKKSNVTGILDVYLFIVKK